jgi:diguanylate cyclase (GGDEF)-like protein
VGGIVVNARDVSERKRTQSLMARQAIILERIAADAALLDTQRLVAATVEEFLPGARVLLRLADDESVQWIAGPSGGIDLRPWIGDSAEIGPQDEVEHLDRLFRGQNSPLERAERRGDPVVVDVETCPLLPADVRQALERCGVAACWVWPLVGPNGSVGDGSIVVAFDRPRHPEPADRDLLALAVQLAGNATDRSRSRRHLAYQASHDALTGLPNRVVVRDRIKQALARLSRSTGALALIFVDLDNFKIINDSLGHRVGDQLLCELGRRLLGLVRPGDTVARLGGDEFVILCEQLPSPLLVESIAQRVLTVLGEPVRLNDQELFVTASLGIALARDPDQDADLLIEDADVAMYRAKQRGGNQYELFHATMRSAAARRLATHTSLRQALDRSELRVHYQPTIDLESRRIVGVEALVRWQHPTRGLLAPDTFIPVAEETGLIVPLGAQVLREACRQLAAWRESFPHTAPRNVAVNLSPRQVTSGDLVRLVHEVLDDVALDPSALSLEITETTLMEDLPGTTKALRELKKVGVRLTIDDFGTGYSSLSYLKQLPVDSLKLDQSFVRHVQSGPDLAIVEMVINLAHTLGLEIVAEGIETPEQLETLRRLGCDIGQGFHLGRPLPSQEIRLAEADQDVYPPQR